MNERIQELAKGAKHAVEQEGILLELVLEKYAELIVLECCQKLENDGMVEVAMEMKQHFGML